MAEDTSQVKSREHVIVVDHATDTYVEMCGTPGGLRPVKYERLHGTSDADRIFKARSIARLYGADYVAVRHGDRYVEVQS